jgi:hypothetical protein
MGSVTELWAAASSLRWPAPPPGSWKSTLAESFVESLNADDPGCAAVLPMNGSTTTIFT